MPFKYFMISLFFLPLFLFSQSDNSEKYYTLSNIEIFGLENLSGGYLENYFTFKKNGTYTISELEKSIALTKARAESDSVIIFLYIDYYVNDDATVELSIDVIEKKFVWIFSGGNAYAKIGKYNLLGPGSSLIGSLGYNLQKIEMDLPSIGGSLLGFSAEFGHELLEPFKPSKFLSRFQVKFNPYIKPLPFIRLGALSRYRHYVRYGDKSTPYEIAAGGFLNLDFTYWQALSPFALISTFSYYNILSDSAKGTHIFSAEGELDIKIRDGFYINLQGVLAGQSTTKTVELLEDHVPGDKDRGTHTWRGRLEIPLKLFTIGDRVEQEIGLIPQVHIGNTPNRFIQEGLPSIAVGGGFYYDLKFPVELRISPGFYYEIKRQIFAFHMSINSL